MLSRSLLSLGFIFFFQAEDGIRDVAVTGVQTCALPISPVTGEAEDVPDIVRETNAAHAAFSPAAAATQTPAALIAQLGDRPDGPHVGDVLAILGRQLETAMKTDRVSQALAIVAGIVPGGQ